MSKIKHSINSAHTQPWVERIGKLIINFSAIEQESIHWFIQLSEQEFEINTFAEIPFTKRVNQIMEHIEERNTGPKWRKKSLRNWNEALKLAHLRNQVAHNPLVFAWSKTPNVGKPDILGIPNMRAGSSSKAQWVVSTNHVDKSINSMVAITKTLAELRTEWCVARDKGTVPLARIQPRLWHKLKRSFYNKRRNS